MSKDEQIITFLSEITMLLGLLVKGNRSQTLIIKELSEVGFQPKRIAELIGTTANTVRVALHQIKRTKAKKK
jgi:hypothetical protein